MPEREDRRPGRRSRAVTASERVYGGLLFLYPEEFREEYAPEMARLFGELCEDELRRGGPGALVIFWVGKLFELLRSARAERANKLPEAEVKPLHAAIYGLHGMVVCPGLGQFYNGQYIKGAAFIAGFFSVLVALLGFGRLFYGPEAMFELALPVLIATWAWSVLDAYLSARRIEALQRANR